MTLTRDRVLELIGERVANDHLRRHMLATEAIMRAVAEKLGHDPAVWGLAGLSHDLDVELTANDFARHGREAAEVLSAAGAPPEVAHAVAAHNEAHTGVRAETALDVALIAADQLSGLITAAALIRPDKSVLGLQLKSLRKRYRETAFARGVDRSAIARCGDLGFTLDDFLAVGLAAMQGAATAVGLEGAAPEA